MNKAMWGMRSRRNGRRNHMEGAGKTAAGGPVSALASPHQGDLLSSQGHGPHWNDLITISGSLGPFGMTSPGKPRQLNIFIMDFHSYKHTQIFCHRESQSQGASGSRVDDTREASWALGAGSQAPNSRRWNVGPVLRIFTLSEEEPPS